jgi:uncharacterized protein
MTHALYIGNVMHERLQPFHHKFAYSVFSMFLDVDTLDQTGSRVFSRNRPNILAFYDRDHGDGSGAPIGDWARAQFAQISIHPAHIRLMCFPRLWGFVFNPLAIYFGYDANGHVIALLHQVSNTFGERHTYLLPVDRADRFIQQSCAKQFHVSPFFDVAGRYAFTVKTPADQWMISIRYTDENGALLLVATQTGERQPFSTAELLKAVARHPLMTLKVVAGIHWEALKLWRRGAGFRRKPPPPETTLTFPQTDITTFPIAVLDKPLMTSRL